MSGLTETGPRYQTFFDAILDGGTYRVLRLQFGRVDGAFTGGSGCAIPEQLLRKITTRSLFAALIPPSGFNQIRFVPLPGVTRREGN